MSLTAQREARPVSRGSWRRIGPLTQFLLIVACGVVLLWNVSLGYVMAVKLHMNDFGKLYYSTRLFLDGQDMYATNPATAIPVTASETREFLDLNPPHAHLPLLPLATMTPWGALVVWTLASVICLMLSVWLIVKHTSVSLASVHPSLLVLGLFAFAGTQTVIVTGQLSFILLLPVTLAWLSARRGRWTMTGFYLGLLISLKLFFLIFVPYLWLRGRWKALITAAATALGCLGLGLLTFGVATHRSWATVLGSIDWTWVAMNASVAGFFSRMFSSTPHFAPLATAPQLGRAFGIACAGAVAVATFAVVLTDRTEESVDRSFALLLLAALLVSPLGWVYYIWFPLGPLVALAVSWAKRVRQGIPPRRLELALMILAGVAFFIPESSTRVFQPNVFLTITLGSAYLWGTAALWTILLLEFRRIDGFPGHRLSWAAARLNMSAHFLVIVITQIVRSWSARSPIVIGAKRRWAVELSLLREGP